MVRRLRDLIHAYLGCSCRPSAYYPLVCGAERGGGGAERGGGGRPRAVLTLREYDETAWSARTWLLFVSQRLSVATQLAAAQEVAEALGLSVAADPRLQ